MEPGQHAEHGSGRDAEPPPARSDPTERTRHVDNPASAGAVETVAGPAPRAVWPAGPVRVAPRRPGNGATRGQHRLDQRCAPAYQRALASRSVGITPRWRSRLPLHRWPSARRRAHVHHAVPRALGRRRVLPAGPRGGAGARGQISISNWRPHEGGVRSRFSNASVAEWVEVTPGNSRSDPRNLIIPGFFRGSDLNFYRLFSPRPTRASSRNSRSDPDFGGAKSERFR